MTCNLMHIYFLKLAIHMVKLCLLMLSCSILLHTHLLIHYSSYKVVPPDKSANNLDLRGNEC